MSVPHIRVENLVKTYRIPERSTGMAGAVKALVRPRFREKVALSGVSFTLDKGELVGYIGPNGAGKSTTVKILAGILVPDAGICEVMGRVPYRERIAHVRRIGVVFGQRSQLWWDLPVMESFDLLRDIYRVEPSAYKAMRDDLITRLDLRSFLQTPVRQLSLGQRMRCELSASLLHSPDILFLDEPTIGLDAVSKLAVREFVRHLNREQGVTVILTTHDMDDIEALCSRVMLIADGQILSDGPLSALREKVTKERWLIIDLEDADALVSDTEAIVLKREGNRVTLAFDPTLTPTAELIARITTQVVVRDLFVQNPPIEEIIARLYARSA